MKEFEREKIEMRRKREFIAENNYFNIKCQLKDFQDCMRHGFHGFF